MNWPRDITNTGKASQRVCYYKQLPRSSLYSNQVRLGTGCHLERGYTTGPIGPGYLFQFSTESRARTELSWVKLKGEPSCAPSLDLLNSKKVDTPPPPKGPYCFTGLWSNVLGAHRERCYYHANRCSSANMMVFLLNEFRTVADLSVTGTSLPRSSLSLPQCGQLLSKPHESTQLPQQPEYFNQLVPPDYTAARGSAV